MGKPEIMIKTAMNSEGKNIMQVYGFWDGEKIANVKALLVEFTPQARKAGWNAVMFLENDEQYEVEVVDVEPDESISDTYYEFGFN